MKTIERICKLTATAALVMVFAVNFNACTEQSPFSAQTDQTETNLTKKNFDSGANGGMGGGGTKHNEAYPQSNSMALQYTGWEMYNGNFMSLPNGSSLGVDMGVLTPPEGTPAGAEVTIAMTCERDSVNNELLFTFGPHGSQFAPSAELKLNWSDLGVEVPTLYYVDDETGAYIEQTPDNINYNKKWMIINIHHFSRYAVAWSQ